MLCLCRGVSLVLINGSVLGVHRQPAAFAAAIRELRRCGKVGAHTSVHEAQVGQEVIEVNNCEATLYGRLCLPMLFEPPSAHRVTANGNHNAVAASRLIMEQF